MKSFGWLLWCVVGVLLLLSIHASNAKPPDPNSKIIPLPSLRYQAQEVNQWLQERKTKILPQLMKQYNVQMWILTMLEYGEDTVFWSLVPATTFSARRRTIYLFYFDNETLTQQTLIGINPSLFDDMMATVTKVNPQRIAVNVDQSWSWGDGLNAGQRDALFTALGNYSSRVVYEPMLAVDYVASGMLGRYQEIMQTVHAIIREAFSDKVIQPGNTTTDDVMWWFREKVQELGMTVWFQPNVAILARDGQNVGQLSGVIQRGDLIWCDFGVVAMGLCTDTQHLAYVLKEDESDAPNGVKAGLQTSNALQDIVLQKLQSGKTGNQILQEARDLMIQQGINGTIYCHPIGDWGHSAGPLIGLWDQQGGVPVRGDALVLNNTWYSIELSTNVAVAEWQSQVIAFPQEEDIYLDSNGQWHWVYDRQTDLYLIGKVPSPSPDNDMNTWLVGIMVAAAAVLIVGATITSIVFYIRRHKSQHFSYENLS